jgi:nucleoside-diphosphate-sugar epimerase
MKVLFIGGTGVISSACSQLAIEQGIELYLLNRGQSIRVAPESAHILQGDIRDKVSIKALLERRTFDVVVDWIAFNQEHIETDLELFKGRTKQYIFISSASTYQTPPQRQPVTESTPLDNPYWEYSRAKIGCENRLMKAYNEDQFPVTIVRPSHTYDQTSLPVYGRYTIIDRMKKGKEVIVHGDGSSLWVLTHHRDFAKGFVGLLGNDGAIGEAFHITSNELLTWNQIVEMIANAAGTVAKIVHIPSDVIATFDPEWGANLLGDKSHSMIFDNSKIKKYVPDFEATIPFSFGVKEIISWFEVDKSRQVVNEQQNQLMDQIIGKWESA